ncbi:MAG TPA: STAS domain-containing protein [Solirubrobacteraceae bacterium]|jgi:anti-anti-sigma factor|nr:STAS domain-containing protein [Solirubrobacteraceae bacterium]
MTALDIQRVGRVPVARPREDVDAATSAQIRDELTTCLAPDVDAVILDLTDVLYLDSAGVDMIFRVGARLRQRRACLHVVIPAASQLTRVVEIVGLTRTIDVHENVEHAIGAAESRAVDSGELES